MASVIFGVYARPCLLDGRHTPGSDAERECPVIRRSLQEAQKSATRYTPTGASKTDTNTPDKSAASTTVFRDGRAGRSGRPVEPKAAQRAKTRERGRRHRTLAQARKSSWAGVGS